MKKILTMPSVLVALLCVVMVATFAVSFAYWKDGIDGNSADKNLNINIGEGSAIETTVNLGSVALDGKALIPNNRTPNAQQTNLITFSVKVTWTAENLTGSDSATFGAHKGQLAVSCKSITLDPISNPKDVTDWTGLGDYPLFDVSADQTFYEIIGNDQTGVEVQITVKMSEPVDRTQYLAVAGKAISITLSFEVKSQYELGNA